MKPQSILLGGQAADKAGAIDTLIDLQAGTVSSRISLSYSK